MQQLAGIMLCSDKKTKTDSKKGNAGHPFIENCQQLCFLLYGTSSAAPRLTLAFISLETCFLLAIVVPLKSSDVIMQILNRKYYTFFYLLRRPL